jgi:hypothetical protein
MLQCPSSKVVEHSSCNLAIKGSNPATDRKMAKETNQSHAFSKESKKKIIELVLIIFGQVGLLQLFLQRLGGQGA